MGNQKNVSSGSDKGTSQQQPGRSQDIGNAQSDMNRQGMGTDAQADRSNKSSGQSTGQQSNQRSRQ